MAEVLVSSDTAIRDWVVNLLIPLSVGLVFVRALHCFVSELLRYSQSAQIFKLGQVVTRAIKPRAGANLSFQVNEDQRLASSSWYLLPEDLMIDEILARLPVKSLMRFKSVCKRWHSLPTNPRFIASHLKHSNTPNTLASWNGNSGLIVGHEGFHSFYIQSTIFTLQPVDLNFGFDRKPDSVLGPCDGIFCISWGPTTRYPTISIGPLGERPPIIALWNPATRALSILPMSKFDSPQYKKVFSCFVGFGFDLPTKSIKVVKVVSIYIGELDDYGVPNINDHGTLNPDEFINCAEVYDSGSGSWRVIHVDDAVQNVIVFDDPTNSMYNNNDGVFYWYSVHKVSSDTGLVLSFDMSRELFHVTLMPERYNVPMSYLFPFKYCHFSLLRDSLAVNLTFREKGHNSTVELWVMKKDLYRVVEAGESFSSYSWSHKLTVELPNDHLFVSMGLWNENELLLWKLGCTRLGDKPFFPFLYDIVTKQGRDLRELNFLYKESLVSVKGGCGIDSIL